MSTGMLENRAAVETPEGTELLLTPAGPGARILAYLLDGLIRIAFFCILSLVFSFFGLFGKGMYFLCFFLLEWFYPVFFEVFRQGATPGKKAFNLRVLYDNGTPVTFSGSMVRNLLRVVDFLPLLYSLGILSMLVTRDFRRLGDLAAGTWVVYDFEKPKRPLLHTPAASDQSQTPSLDTPCNPVQGSAVLPIPLDLEEQRAIIGFAERSGSLSGQRQAELANLLTPLIQLKDEAAVGYLQRVANGLTGKGQPALEARR